MRSSRLAYMLVATVAGMNPALPTAAQTSSNAPADGNAPINLDTPKASDNAAAAPPSESGSTKLEEIVVTATKRKQVAREIPSTINVLTGAALEKQGARDLEGFVDQVPGLQIEDSAIASSRKIIIRGVGPDDTTNATVGVVLGDIPLGDPFGNYTVIDPDPWDLKDVDVLKGPQGTLFGASSLAGIIRYVPNDPELGQWQGKAFSEWTEVKQGGFEPTFGGALNVPLGSTLAIRGSGIYQHAPGLIDIDTPGRQVKNADDAHKWEGRFMALWRPIDRLSINAWFMEQQTHRDENSYVTNFDGNLSRNDAPTPSPSHKAFSLANLDTRYTFDWATLISLTGFQHKVNQFSLDDTYILEKSVAEAGVSLGRAQRDVAANGVVQELRLVSNDKGPWTWQGGAFYSAYSARIFSDIYLSNTGALVPILGQLPLNLGSTLVSENGISLGNASLNPAKAGEHALFGELTRALGPVNITLGGRLYQTEVDGTSTVSGGTGSLTHLITNTPSSTYLDVKGQGFSPKLAAAWRASNNVLAYASASRGFQYGGVNVVAIDVPGDVVPPTYRSSTLWNYETGIRTDWFHKTLRADVTGFYQQWSNAQISQSSASQLDVYVDNVGEVVSRGIEWSLRYKLPFVKGLSIETSGNYLEAKTATEFINSSGTVVPSGTDMSSAPRVQGSGMLSYARQFDGKWNMQTALIYTHVNTSWNDIEHDHLLDARDLLNVNLLVSRTDLPVSPTVSVIVNNITNQKRLVSVAEGAETATVTATEGIPAAYTRPRTVILRFSVDF